MAVVREPRVGGLDDPAQPEPDRLFLHARVFGAAELDVELEDEACVKDAIAAIGLEDRVDIWVLVNGTRTGRDTRLSNGAELTFFQPVGGG